MWLVLKQQILLRQMSFLKILAKLETLIVAGRSFFYNLWPRFCFQDWYLMNLVRLHLRDWEVQ